MQVLWKIAFFSFCLVLILNANPSPHKVNTVKMPSDTLHFWSDIQKANSSVFSHHFFQKDSYELPFYVARDSAGKFYNQWSNMPLTAGDTVPHLICAEGTSTCMGLHAINQAHARLLGDTILLHIGLANPAYNDNLTIRLLNGRFSAGFQTTYFYPVENIGWKTLQQQLQMDKIRPVKGDFIRGEIAFTCLEIRACESDTIRIRSLFKIKIE